MVKNVLVKSRVKKHHLIEHGVGKTFGVHEVIRMVDSYRGRIRTTQLTNTEFMSNSLTWGGIDPIIGIV